MLCCKTTYYLDGHPSLLILVLPMPMHYSLLQKVSKELRKSLTIEFDCYFRPNESEPAHFDLEWMMIDEVSVVYHRACQFEDCKTEMYKCWMQLHE